MDKVEFDVDFSEKTFSNSLDLFMPQNTGKYYVRVNDRASTVLLYGGKIYTKKDLYNMIANNEVHQ